MLLIEIFCVAVTRAGPLKNHLWAVPVTPVVLNLLGSTCSLENLMKLMKAWTLLPRKVDPWVDRPYLDTMCVFVGMVGGERILG